MQHCSSAPPGVACVFMHVKFKTVSALKHGYKAFCGPHRAHICTGLSSDHRVPGVWGLLGPQLTTEDSS